MQPEVREWVNVLGDGPEAEEPPLPRRMERLDREGAPVLDRRLARLRLFSHYCRHKQRDKALAMLAELDRQAAAEAPGTQRAEPTSWWRRTWSSRFRNTSWRIVNRELTRLSQEHADPSHQCHNGAWLNSIKLVLLVNEGRDRSVIGSALAEVSRFLGAHYARPEFIPTLRTWIEQGYPTNEIVHLLRSMWAELATQWMFSRLGNPDTLREIEELLARIGSAPTNEVD